MKKRFFLIFLIFLSCSTKVKTPADTLVIGLEAIPKNPHDPRLAMVDAYSSKISHLLFNSLFRVNERMEVEPDLVTTYKMNSPTSFTFQLRNDALFHDGRPLTSSDVKKTIESILNPATLSPHRGTLEVIQSVEAPNPTTLKITLKKVFSPLLVALRFGILPDGKDVGIGSGPYQLEKFDSAKEVILVRNEKYPGKRPKLRRLHFRVIPDDNVRVLELLGGGIDFVQNNVPPPLFDNLRRKKNLSSITTNGVNYSYLGFNLRSPPLNDRNVREAIAHSLDIPTIIRSKLGGLGTPATGILPPVHWAFEGDVQKYEFNPVRARALLDQAGYKDPDGPGPGMRFTLTYKTSTKKDRIGLARLMARYLKDVGIGVRVLPYEWGTFFHDIRTGNFQLYSLTWVSIVEPDIFHYIFSSSQFPPKGANRGGYQNESVDKLTLAGRGTMDTKKRKEAYSVIQKILSQDLPYVSLWYEKNVAVFQNNVKGVRLRPDAGFEIFLDMYKQP